MMWPPLLVAACFYHPAGSMGLDGETTGGTSSGSSSEPTEGAGGCGNGVVEGAEECDGGGETAECDGDCTLPECGDGVHNALAGEECDDGAESAMCNMDCTAARCGDGKVNTAADERCDDGNELGGDDCSPACTSTRIVGLAAGASHTCAVFDEGQIHCWGPTATVSLDPAT